jgi:hypothetical protein
MQYDFQGDILHITNHHRYDINNSNKYDNESWLVTHVDRYDWYINYTDFITLSNYPISQGLTFEFDLCNQNNICFSPTTIKHKQIINTTGEIWVIATLTNNQQMIYYLNENYTMLDIKLPFNEQHLQISSPKTTFTIKNLKSESIRTSDFDLNRTSLSASNYETLEYKDFVLYDNEITDNTVHYLLDFSYNSNPFKFEVNKDTLILTIDNFKNDLKFRWKDDSEGYNNPQNCDSIGFGGQWTDCLKARTDGSGYAYCTAKNKRQEWENFGFSIPLDATVNGVEMKIDAYMSIDPAGNGVRMYLIKNGGSTVSNKKIVSLTNSETTYNLGSDSDLWGLSLTPSSVNANGFGAMALSGKSSRQSWIGGDEQRMDWVRLEVYYTPAPAVAGVQRILLNTRTTLGSSNPVIEVIG